MDVARRLLNDYADSIDDAAWAAAFARDNNLDIADVMAAVNDPTQLHMFGAAIAKKIVDRITSSGDAARIAAAAADRRTTVARRAAKPPKVAPARTSTPQCDGTVEALAAVFVEAVGANGVQGPKFLSDRLRRLPVDEGVVTEAAIAALTGEAGNFGFLAPATFAPHAAARAAHTILLPCSARVRRDVLTAARGYGPRLTGAITVALATLDRPTATRRYGVGYDDLAAGLAALSGSPASRWKVSDQHGGTLHVSEIEQRVATHGLTEGLPLVGPGSVTALFGGAQTCSGTVLDALIPAAIKRRPHEFACFLAEATGNGARCRDLAVNAATLPIEVTAAVGIAAWPLAHAGVHSPVGAAAGLLAVILGEHGHRWTRAEVLDVFEAHPDVAQSFAWHLPKCSTQGARARHSIPPWLIEHSMRTCGLLVWLVEHEGIRAQFAAATGGLTANQWHLLWRMLNDFHGTVEDLVGVVVTAAP